MAQLAFLINLIRRSGDHKYGLIRASVLAGALEGLLLYVMGASIEELSMTGAVGPRNFLLFVGSLAGLYMCLKTSMRISSAVARDMVTGLELRITEKISETSYTHFSSIDQGRIYTAITGAKDVIHESAIMLPVFICSCTMMLCSLIFSALISIAGLVAVLLVMGMGALIFFLSDKRFIAALNEYREALDPLQASLKDVIRGFVELKMNEEKRQVFFDQVITPLSNAALAKRIVADDHRMRNTVMYGLLAYFPVGALLYALPQTGLANLEQCVKIVAITMFSTIPLIGLLSFMPMAARAAFIVDGLENFERKLDAMRDSDAGAPSPPPFASLRIESAGYSYPAQDSNGAESVPFKIDAANFSLSKGELVFLSGGNGSGKSTFMRMLAGLVPPSYGEILVNGVPAREMGYAQYRSFFSVLFPDFHLFAGLYGINATPEHVKAMLGRMALNGKVAFDPASGRFSTVALSSGQKKRLALACALLENRPVLLLDEVAADFDFHFRETFYRRILPELKAEGRAMLVISHDDRYFDVADRVLRMCYGKFEDIGA